ncbi:MAG TPA: hypothetical protein V6D28_27880 [Leptolyngbyaceae cyanobacterium]
MPVNRRKPEWKKIKPFTGIDVLYGFESRTASGDQAELGQANIDIAADFNKLVIYPNNCRPHTATKKGTAGSSSGYIDESKISTAQQAGWKIKWGYPPRRRRAKGTNKNIKIDVNTINYAYIRASDPLYDQLANCGHETPDSNDILWYGCQFPRPPKVSVIDAQGRSVSSFCQPSKVDEVVSAGGTLIHPGNYTQTHLANMVISAAPAAP